MTLSQLSPFEQQIVDNVDQHGCSVLSVFDPKGEEPDFSYSIGFAKSARQPEVIVFSLPKGLRHSMINEICRQLTEEDLKLSDGLVIENLIEGFPCVARQITDQAAITGHFGSAIWYARRFCDGDLVSAFQIVWPGAQQGLFPWDPGCSEAVIQDQPALYHTGPNS